MECTHLNSVGYCNQKAAKAKMTWEDKPVHCFLFVWEFFFVLFWFRFFEIGFLCTVLAVLELTL